jgi:hypothetical protein
MVRNFFPQEDFNDANFPIQRVAGERAKSNFKSEGNYRQRSLEASFFSADKMKVARAEVRWSLKQIEAGLWAAEAK